MSQHSLLNIQEISSRTFNQQHSIMDTSIEHFGREPHNLPNMMGKSAKKSAYPTYEQIIKIQQQEIERYKNTLTAYINRIQEIQKGKVYNNAYEIQIKELMVMLNERQNQIDDLKERYKNAIMGLQETVQKNEMLYREVEKYKKKNNDLELNYSRDQNVFNKSQNLISNLSITKSNYEIELVNMKDSLVVLQKQKKKILDTNEEYEEKLAMLSQEVERLRGVNEIFKKDSEKLKLTIKQQQEFIQRIQYENHQSKQAIQRLRIQNRDLKNNNSSTNLQLQEYHEKVMYKQTLVSDLQERENRISQFLKLKDTQILQLQAKVQQYSQDLDKIRLTLSEKSNSEKKIEIQKQQIIREYNELILRFQSLKRQHESMIAQKQNLIQELQEQSHQKAGLIKQLDQRLKERQRMIRQIEILRDNLAKSQANFKLTNEERVKQYQATIRLFQQKDRNLLHQFQLNYENLNEQKNKQINTKTIEINRLKADIVSRDNQIAQFRSQIANKSTEIAQLKTSTMSQSTIIDNTRRDYEQKVRQKTQMITQLKIKLQNYQKLIEQNRRERDMIFQQKNALLLQLQKSEQYSQAHSNDLKTYIQKNQALNSQVIQLETKYESSMSNLDNYKRILDDNQNTLKQYSAKLKESQSRIIALTNQLQRMTSLLKEKQVIIFELNAQKRQINSMVEEKKGQVVSLREINQKLTTNLSRSDESKGNFQTFMRQIERLNQVITSKEGQIKGQKVQLAKIIQKIDLLYKEQLKIIKIMEDTYTDDAKKNMQLNNQLSQLKEYILKINKNTSGTLQDISKQSGTILNLLNHTESQTKNHNLRLNDQITQTQTLLSNKDHQIQILKRQIQDLNNRLLFKQQNQTKQEEVFQKLIQLSQQNAAIKDQLNYSKGQHQMELQAKNQSIIQLQSKVNLFEKKQKRQIQELTEYINQKQLTYNNNIQRFTIQKQDLISKLAAADKLSHQKQRQIEVLKSEKAKAQKNLDQLVVSINPRLSQLQKTNELLTIYTKEIQRYKIQIKKLQSKSITHQSRIQENSRVSILQKQIQKLQNILQIRNAQLSNNQQSYFKLKAKLNEAEKQCIKQKMLVKQLKTANQTLAYQLKKSQQLRESRFRNQQSIQSMSELKDKNNQLNRQLKKLQNKLTQSQSKLDQANQQINSLQIQLHKILQTNSKSINTISLLQSKQSQRQHLIERIYNLQDQLQETKGELRQIQIENGFMRSSKQQSQIHLHAYQFKTAQLQKEYLKLKQVIVNINNQNSKLLTNNHFFQIQLKKAQILQQKIQVLNGQINRLSSENINLSEQVTSFKLALSGEYSLQKKSQEQLTLIFLLFTEIEALRNRLKQNEQRLQYSHNQQLYRYRS